MNQAVSRECLRHVTYLFACLMLINGFAAQIPSQSMIGHVLIGFGLSIAIHMNLYCLRDSCFAVLDSSPSASPLEFAAPCLDVVGSLWCLIALFSVSDVMTKMVWFGLIGSSLMHIGALLNVVGSLLRISNVNSASTEQSNFLDGSKFILIYAHMGLVIKIYSIVFHILTFLM